MTSFRPRAKIFHHDHRPTSLPLSRELFVGIDWLALKLSPIYYGVGAPRGDGAPVVVVPGFMGTDLYLGELYFWLQRIGYKPYMSRIGRNADCLDLLANRLLSTVKKAYSETNRPVNLIGHSLGGILSCSVAAQRPDLVASVVTLGSPIQGIRSHPMVLQAADVVRDRIYRLKTFQDEEHCFTGGCSCPSVAILNEGLPGTFPHMAVYTKTDGVVDWRACINEDPATDFEVPGTHVGLTFNPVVYDLIANWLPSATKQVRAVA